jgi:4-amino-4-deoxy-L-arabinose transferase-like glycosyltransferase
VAAWIFVAAIGGVLSILGLLVLTRRYLRGEMPQSHLIAIIVGYVSFVSFVLVSSLSPEFAGGPLSIAILLPVFAAIVFLVREHQKSKGP